MSGAGRPLRRLLRDPLAVLAALVVAAVVAAAAVGPRLTGFDPEVQVYEDAYLPPDSRHWAGTDSLGRDLAARLLAGARISLLIALVAGLINLLLGVSYGAIAAYAGGRIDAVMMRIVDVLYGIPTILVVILFMVWLDQGITNIYLAIGLTYWLNMARLVRGEVLSLKEREFVQAARALGAGPGRVLARHILPNCTGVVLVTLTLFIPEAIFLEAFLSYIGLGVPAPAASWGSLAADGARNLLSHPHLLLFPASAICITMLAFNILGDALRDLVSGDHEA